MKKFLISKLLFGILLLGLWLRTIGVNWDSLQHLNPDERFLTMVLSAMKWPGWSDYLRTSISTYNPVNVGYGFFVYGTLPLLINKLVAGVLGMGDYNGYLIVGRVLSAIFDTGTIWIVYLLGREMGTRLKFQVAGYSHLVGLVAAFFYAVAVIPIQNSHFFIADTFGNFFAAISLLLGLKLMGRYSNKTTVALGMTLGMALSCKLSLLLIFPGVGLAVAIGLFKKIKLLLVAGILFSASVYISFRLLMPYAFQDFSGYKLEKRFLHNNQIVRGMVSGEIDMPPSIQWAGTNFVWPVQEIALWGWSLPVSILLALALGWMLVFSVKNGFSAWLPVWTVLLVPFIYQAHLLAKAQRYFLGAYPIFSIVLASFLVLNKNKRWMKYVFSGALLTALLWAIGLTRIYRAEHSRVAASKWIYKAISPKSNIGWEHWDDPLPLLLDGHQGGEYPGIEMSLYDRENEQKLEKLVSDLEKSDFIVLSSNRLYGSIPKMPGRFPLATLYYQLLFAEKLGFVKIAEFTSYPGIGKFRVNDDLAEELFTVYDHPKVTIFMKQAGYSQISVRNLFAGVDFRKVYEILPKDL